MSSEPIPGATVVPIPLRVHPRLVPPSHLADRPVAPWRRLWSAQPCRVTVVLAALVLAWQLYARRLGNPLVLPDPAATALAFRDALRSGELLERTANSLRILALGYGAGAALALLLTALAVNSPWILTALETCTALFNPLPAIALLPLAMLWFGLGTPSILFVLVHSVLWPVALGALSGCASVSPTLRMSGRIMGLKGPSLAFRLLLPAALPSVVTGLKTGWAVAWRTLIAAELVFGVSSGSGGLGWFIYEKKNQLEIPTVFAGLLTVILIGVAVEYLVFGLFERRTLQRWGMK
jgi:NitT/TauT family transport system permease protein